MTVGLEKPREPDLAANGSSASNALNSEVPKCYFEQAMARDSTASEKVRAAAARRGYIPPIDPALVPAELRAAIAEELGLSRQAVNNALQRPLGSRKGRPTSASTGRARSQLDTENVVRWLRAAAKGKSPSGVALLLAAAKAIEQGHVDTWIGLDGEPLD